MLPVSTSGLDTLGLTVDLHPVLIMCVKIFDRLDIIFNPNP